MALEEQLDGMRIQKSTLESLLEKEKNSKQSIQQGLSNMFCLLYHIWYVYVELDQLSLEYQQKIRLLNSTSIRENELKVEVLNLQKNLQTTQQHFTESETEVLYIRSNKLYIIVTSCSCQLHVLKVLSCKINSLKRTVTVISSPVKYQL